MVVRLCVMYSMFRFFLCCRFVSRFSILSWIDMLSIDMGLLVMMN